MRFLGLILDRYMAGIKWCEAPKLKFIDDLPDGRRLPAILVALPFLYVAIGLYSLPLFLGILYCVPWGFLFVVGEFTWTRWIKDEYLDIVEKVECIVGLVVSPFFWIWVIRIYISTI